MISAAALVISIVALINSGRTLERQDLLRAEELLGEVAAILPESGSLAASTLERAYFDRAMRLLYRAEILSPDHFQVFYYRGLLYYLMGDNDKSEQALRRAERIIPGQGDTHAIRGLIQMRTGMTVEAINSITTATVSRPQDESLRLVQAYAYYKDRSYGSAISILNELESQGAKDPMLPMLRGMCYLRLLGPAEALVEIERVLKVRPDWVPAVSMKVDILTLQGHFEAALDLVGRLPAHVRSESRWLRTEVSLLRSLERDREAIGLLQVAWQRDRDRQLGYDLIDALVAIGDTMDVGAMGKHRPELAAYAWVQMSIVGEQWGDAVAVAKAAADDGDLLTVDRVLVALLEKGRLSDVEDVGRYAIAVSPGCRVETYLLLGEALRRLRKPYAEAQLYHLGLGRCGTVARFYSALANVMLDIGKVRDAIGFAEKALADEPTNLVALSAMGNALFRRHHYRDACHYFQSAASLAPVSEQATRNLAICKAKLDGSGGFVFLGL